MLLTRNLACVILLVASITAFAQRHTVSGYVSDGRTQEKIAGAIVVDLRTRHATSSNNFGFFSLTLTGDSASVMISYIGYKAFRKNVSLSGDVNINVDLAPDAELKTVEVNAGQAESVAERTRMSTINIPVEQIKKVPAFLGEVDVLKVLQLLPGVKSGGEGTTGLYVRGGGPDQNLILLDGAPIYNASHVFGFFSTFNADAIRNVELTKGGFPARYGGRLSSVLDITMKEGNMRRYNVEGQISLVASKIMIEGPIWKNRTSFIVSARRTYIDKLLGPLLNAGSSGGVGGGYYFYDLNAKVNHKISDRDRLFLSFYNGLDKFSFKTGSGLFAGDTEYSGYLRWGNTLGALRWNHVFNSRLFCNVNATYTRYRFGVGQKVHDYTNETIEKADYFSGIADWAGRVNFDYIPSPDHYVRFGVHAIYHTFLTGAQQVRTQGFARDVDSVSGNPAIFGWEGNAYAEDDWKVSQNFKVNYGVHLAGMYVQDNFYRSVQPRVSMRYLLPFGWSAKASYASMMQFMHLLSNSNVGLPTDLWVPATRLIKPQRSYQGAVGLAKSLRGNNYEISVEGYYKEMKDIIDYREGANFIGGASEWEKKVDQGRGWSYGGELFIQKKKGKYTGWIGYTLSWTNRQFANINDGKAYPYKYDRRHDISFVNLYKISNKLDIGLTWVYGTGNAISLPLQTYQAAYGSQYSDIQYYGGKNNYRMAPYHRLDFSVNRHRKKKWGVSTLSFGAYNVYGRQNPYFLYFTTNTYGRRQLRQVSLFPFIPNISWSFKFDFRKFKEIFKDDEELAEFESQESE